MINLSKKQGMQAMKQMKSAGFTIPEMLLVVAMLGILMSLMFPTFSQFMNEQRLRNEQATMQEVRRAMEAYARDNNELPMDNEQRTSGDPFWYEELSRYTNMSENELQFDEWNRERIYRRTDPITEIFRDAEFDVFYASIFSGGNDGVVDPNTVGAGTTNVAPASNDTAWWAEQPDPVDSYGDMVISGDDVAVKFTDLKIKTEHYTVTQERLKDLALALESYSQAKLNEALVANEAQRQTNINISIAANESVDPDTGLNDVSRYINNAGTDFVTPQAGTTAPVPYTNPSDLVYYPPADGAPIANTRGDKATYYPTTVTETDSFLAQSFGDHGSRSGLRRVINSNNDDARRDSMMDLMRLLGLPDTHCCNAMVRDASNTEIPFYYFSNPRPRLFSGGVITCGNRPAAAPFLPARVTVERIGDNAGTATVAPTCW